MATSQDKAQLTMVATDDGSGDDAGLLDEEFLLELLLSVDSRLEKLQKQLKPGHKQSKTKHLVKASTTAKKLAQDVDTLWQVSALEDGSSEYVANAEVVSIMCGIIRCVNLYQPTASANPPSSPASDLPEFLAQCLQRSHGVIANLVVTSVACRTQLLDARISSVTDSRQDGRRKLSTTGRSILFNLYGTIDGCSDVGALAQVFDWIAFAHLIIVHHHVYVC